MPTLRVHNLSDRTDAPVSVMIGGKKLRPGQVLDVVDTALNRRHRAMHGAQLWIGSTPPASKVLPAAAAVTSGPMSLADARAYLAAQPQERLMQLAAAMTPPLVFPGAPSVPALVSRIGRALFQDHRELDPEVFAWLGRWNVANGVFTLKE